MLVFENLTQNFSIISNIYAPTQPHEKDTFCAHLSNLNSVTNKPWCLIGDFNELECLFDKKGPMATPSWLSQLPYFLSFSRAIAMLVLGRPFTWKKSIHQYLVYKKLDRAIGRYD